MNTHKPTTHHHTCDDEPTRRECTSGARNRYFKGKRLGAEEFRLEQAYGVARRRLINRAVLGWGVVRGFTLHKPASPPVPFGVGGGFALDRHGRELVLFEPVELNETNTFLATAGQMGCEVQSIDAIKDTTRDAAGGYLLMAHYAERRFGDVPRLDDCGCDAPEKNFICETVVFSLTPLAYGKCPCEEADCNRVCECRQAKPDPAQQAPSVQQAPAPPAPAPTQPPDPPAEKTCGEKGRGPHECLCHWLTNADELKTPRTLCAWNGYCVAIPDGVPLGCVKAWKEPKGDAKECDVIMIELTDGCSPRRLVKNNDVLYDLIRGCDLTRIKSISWEEWHRRGVAMPWQTFYDMFFETPLAPLKPGEPAPSDVATRFVVAFSGLVRRDTIRRDAVVMTAVTVEKDSNWLVTKRVPIAQLDSTPSSTAVTADPNLTDQVRVVVRYGWIHDELLQASGSDLSGSNFVIEVEVRGDLITDCHGQSVDANAIGPHAAPSGNGTPGGTYLSSFPVESKPANPHDRGTW